MTKIYPVKLEFLRPGPPHNQLLSPLTPYMALCGEGSPVTFHLDFEHHQFLNRLGRLRYITFDGPSGVAVPDSIRENAMAEVGMDVGRIFAKMNTLLAEEWRVMEDPGTAAADDGTRFVDLRLVLSASELALIPFEMAIAPQAYPGEGLEWALQLHLPIVPIREIRRTRPVPVRWDGIREPKILFISAAPQGLEVPLASHVQALREALDPWIRWPMQQRGRETEENDSEKGRQRMPFIKERLRLLPNASIDDIYKTCALEQFTHVHILAHGAHLEVGGERRYGLALCKQGDCNRMQVISGKRLAKALMAEAADGTRRSRPLLVSLATCDSGNPGSVLIPGGGIAHDLHIAGIPWVLASQLPLTKAGSVRMTKTFYQHILRGDDPRRVLYEVRRRLHMNAERDHDWASIVAYATIPPDFDDQVTAFFKRQMILSINIALNHADHAVGDELKSALELSMNQLELWRSRLPDGSGHEARERRAECFGMHGSTLKRIALLHYRQGDDQKGREELEKALAWYDRAIEQWAIEERLHHWVSTQALSLKAVLDKAPDPENWVIAGKLARRDLEKSRGSSEAWAHGTMAELFMLATYHIPEQKIPNIKKQVQEHCSAIVQLMGEDSFEAYSTRRQFQRYIDYWDKARWRPIAKAAMAALTPSGKKDQSKMPSIK